MLALAAALAAAQDTPPALRPLVAGQAVEREIGGVETHLYSIALRQGEFLRVGVEQLGINVKARLCSPSGAELIAVDLLGNVGTEPISYEVLEAGEYQLQVRAAVDSAPSGRYRVTCEVSASATERDRQRLAAERSLAEVVALWRGGGPGQVRAAAAKSRRNIEQWRGVGDKYWLALALDLGGNIHNRLGEWRKALDYHLEAVLLWEAIGRRGWQANTHEKIGQLYRNLNEGQKALDSYDKALRLYEVTQDRNGEADVLNNIGLVYKGDGDRTKALEYYERALAIYKTVADPVDEANTLFNVGRIHASTGERRKALDYYLRAVKLYRTAGDRGREADTLTDVGDTHDALGERQKAIEYYDRALSLYRGDSNRQGEADVLTKLGDSYFSLIERRKALGYHNLAAELYRAGGQRGFEAGAHLTAGNIRYALGEMDKAVDSYRRALSLYKAAGDRRGQATALANIGWGYRRLRERRKAIDHYEQALLLHRADGERNEEAKTLFNIGYVYSDMGDRLKALEQYRRALAVYKAAGNRSGEVQALDEIGIAYDDLGKPREALEYYEQAVELGRGTERGARQPGLLIDLALSYEAVGDKQKALAHYQQALPLYRARGDRMHEARTLADIASLYASLDDSQRALENYEQAVKLHRETGDRGREAGSLMALGDVYSSREDYRKALECYLQALPLWRAEKARGNEAQALDMAAGMYFLLGEKQKAVEHIGLASAVQGEMGDRTGRAQSLAKGGFIYYLIGEKQKALDYFLKSITLLKPSDARTEVATQLLGAGFIFILAGDYDTALEYYRQVFSHGNATGNRMFKAASLIQTGKIYDLLEDDEKAFAFLRQGLSLYRAMGDRDAEAGVKDDIGNFYLSRKSRFKRLSAQLAENKNSVPASTLAFDQFKSDLRADVQRADRLFRQALTHYRAVKNRRGEVSALTNIGVGYHILDDTREALNYLQQALLLLKEAPDQGLEIKVHYRLMLIWDDLSNPQLAILHGKQVVNTLQSFRSQISKLDSGFEQSIARQMTDAYRDLVNLLIRQGRLLEAEQVLGMLKEEEFHRFVRRDDKVARDLLKRVNLSPAEREALEGYDKIAEVIISLAREDSKLEDERLRLPLGRADSLIARQRTIRKQLGHARESLRLYLTRLKEKLGVSDKRVAAVEEGLQAAVGRWGEPRTVVLSTIVGKDGLSIILTTASIQRAYVVDEIEGEKFSEEKLNLLIAEFRAGVMDYRIDPRPSGQKLYNILIKPLEKDLQSAGADTIVWSLDANLRYVPVAALYDARRGYLAERYSNAIITLASHHSLEARPADKDKWRALGLGVSKPVAGFTPLVNVPDELEAIVRDEEKNDQTGLLDGRLLLNEGFTLEALERFLGSFKVIHAATHFSFITGTRSESLESFLLLGSGERLTLESIQKAGTMFSGVELLVLSACDTAAGGKGADGSEVESFGVLAQRAGARTVIATLWPVADASTRELMVGFYQLHGATPDINKAEALRRAQLRLLNGEMEAGGMKARADLAGREQTESAHSTFRTDPRKPYAHPYYWAPFILIGNWR